MTSPHSVERSTSNPIQARSDMAALSDFPSKPLRINDRKILTNQNLLRLARQPRSRKKDIRDGTLSQPGRSSSRLHFPALYLVGALIRTDTPVTTPVDAGTMVQACDLENFCGHFWKTSRYLVLLRRNVQRVVGFRFQVHLGASGLSSQN